MAQRTRSDAVVSTYGDDDPGPTVAMAIAAQLREEILRSFDDGQLVGSEDDLISRFDVSRPTMRQVVRILQSDDLLVVKRGSNGGMFAKVPSSDLVARSMSMLLRHRGVTFEQLVDALLPLTELVLLSAISAPDDRRKMAAASVLEYRPPDELDDRERILAAARHFGKQINSLVSNPVLTLMLEALSDLATGGVRDAPSGAGRYESSREWHCNVARAVKRGDRKAVVRLVREMQAQLPTWSR
jgi:GntR family transcriptional regulator, transcriptional repressor for pyruvate dehydrogenase complex